MPNVCINVCLVAASTKRSKGRSRARLSHSAFNQIMHPVVFIHNIHIHCLTYMCFCVTVNAFRWWLSVPILNVHCSVQRAVEDSFTGSQTLGKYLSRIWALCQSFIPIRLHAAEIQARAHPVLRCNEGQTPKTLPQWHSHTQSHWRIMKHCSGLKQSSLVQCHTCETRSALLQQKQQTIKF